MSEHASSVAERAPAPAGVATFEWAWRGTPMSVGFELTGPASAAPVLLLPALSTVSTRDEMRPLARALAARRVVAADWPGFGDQPRARLDYEPALYRTFLEDLVAHLRQGLGATSVAVVATGHAASYALDLEARRPGSFTRLALIAPTWRGPLPTMMGGRRPIQERIRKLIHTAGIGALLYRLNVSRPVMRRMFRGHVYADPAFVTEAHLTRRLRVAHQPGARFASACFVTGALDPYPGRDAWLAAARQIAAPILVIYGEGTPPRSRAEMAALGALANVERRVLARGALGMAEEMAAELAPLIEAFLERP